jgi:WD40 repeat protein
VATASWPGEAWRAERSPGGTHVVLSTGAALALWDLEQGRETARIRAAGTVADAAVSLDGRFLATRTDDNVAQVWNLMTRREVWRGEKIARASLNADGSLVATAGYDDVIRMRALPSGEERWHQDGVPATVEEENTDGDDVTHPNVEALVFSVDEKQVGARLRKKAPRIWDVSTGRDLQQAAPGVLPDWIVPTAGGIVRAARTPGGIDVWSSAAGSQPAKLAHDSADSKLFVANGRLATAVGPDVRLWEAGSGRRLGTMKSGDSYVQQVAISPDGARAATITFGPTAALYDVGAAQPRAQLAHDAGPNDEANGIIDVTFSPDSKYLATASSDRTARVWDAETGREVARFVHDGGVSLVAFSHDGGRLTTVSDDQRVHVWLWRDTDLIDKACARLSRNLTPEEWQAQFGSRRHAKTCDRLP